MRNGLRARTGLPSRPEGILLGSGIGLRPPRPDRPALYGSLAFHAVLVTGLVLSGALATPDIPEFQTFRVRIFSPPPQVQGPPAPAPAVTQTIVQEPVVDRPVVAPRPKEPVVERPEQTRVAEVKTADPKPVAGDRPDPKSAGGEGIDVDIEGQEFPFPEYLENIVLQMRRYFRWAGENNPEVVVAFYIARDGSVGGLRVVEKSIDFRFDMQAMDAVTQAGRRGAFGALPDGWVQDRLWVKFRFIPPGG
jgi:hypothetical protein